MIALLLLSANAYNKGPFPDSSWNMELLATWTDGDTATIFDVAAYQNYIYLAHNRKGVTILVMWDSAGKTVVRQVGRIDSGRIRSFVDIRDSLLYCGYNDLLKIYSLSDPANPVFLGMDSTDNYWVPWRTQFHGDYFFVGGVTVYIYNISDPTNPYLTSIVTPSEWADCGSFALQDTPYCKYPALFVGYTMPWGPDSGSWIASYNIADPENPVWVSSRYLGFYGYYTDVEPIAAYLNYLYVFVWNEVFLFDISDPGHLIYLGSSSSPVYFDALVREDASKMYLADWHWAEVRDLTDPLDIRLLGWYKADSITFRAVAWQGGRTIMLAGTWPPYIPWDGLYILHYTGDTLEPLPAMPWPHEPRGFSAIIVDGYLRLRIPRKDHVSLRVFDPSGRLVEDVFSGYLGPGVYEFDLGIRDNPAGIYLVQVIWDGEKTTLKAFVKGGD
jgi:hypothetical protein